jgi:Concanavalin A-like lectin/glucanases superfamily
MNTKSQATALAAAAALFFTIVAQAQVTLTDVGGTAPTPGALDITQNVENNTIRFTAPFNYYSDNTSDAPGQTFGNGPNPLVITSLALQTSLDNGGGGTGPQVYELRFYSVSGSAATLITTYTSPSSSFTAGDWIQWSGLSVPLSANGAYAYCFRRLPSGSGWCQVALSTNNLYAAGQAALIPPAGGTMTFYGGGFGPVDAVFDIGLSLPPSAPVANPPAESPASANLAQLSGSPVTLTASAAGTTPIYFQWQTDGGSGGALTNIPGATSAVLTVNTPASPLPSGTYQYDFVASNSFGTNVSSIADVVSVAVFMADVGATNPVPGPLDISQLLNSAQNDDGINYYTDDGAGHGNWAGQTFTTGTNGNGYLMTSLAWKSAGNGNSFGTIQLYDLYIYSLSGGGTTASQIASYQAYGGGTENDWFKWFGLNVPLAANTVYAYAFGRDGTAGGWEHIGDQGGNPYPGGQLCTIPSPTGGTVTYGTSGNSDATFDIGLVLAQAPSASPPSYTPNVSPIYANTLVTFSEVAVGPPPLHYQWLADNGTGTLTTVGGANGTNLAVNTTGFAPGTYQYAIIVSNAFGASTSTVVALSIVAASAPVIVADTTPSNVLAYVEGDVTFTASFQGTLPITNQWLVNPGSGFVNVPNGTNTTLALTNLQLSAAGIYALAASNSVGSASSTPVSLAFLPTPPPPTPALAFPYAVLADGPLAYWRFGETNDPSTNYLETYDATGNGYIGVYGTGVTDGGGTFAAQGPQSPTFPGFEATNTGIEVFNGTANNQIILPPLNLNTNSLTITMWINPVGAVGTFWGLLFNRTPIDAAGIGFGGNVNGSGMAELGYTWNTNSAATWGFHSGLFPPEAQWSFVALTITPSNATLNLCYVNGSATNVFVAVNNIPHDPEGFTGGETWIGSDPAGGASGRNFTGYIDEVAVFKHALTQSQIVNLFMASLGVSAIAPDITTEPASESTYAGQVAGWTVLGGGSGPLSYQWQAGVTGSGVFTNVSNGGGISGATSSTLTIDPATTADGADYQVIIANSAGSVTSSVATLTVLPVPVGQWVVNFEVTNNINASPGLFQGRGVLWNGTTAPRTNWNPISDPLGDFVGGIFDSTSDLQDNGTVHSGIGAVLTSTGGGYSSGGNGVDNVLLTTYVLTPASLLFTNVPNGIYNLALYGVDGSYHDRGIIFTVDGSSQTLLNASDLSFVLGDNLAIYTDVPVTNGTLAVDMAPNPVAHGGGNTEGDFDGAQLQLVALAPVLTSHWNGSTLTLSWPAGSILLQAPDVTGPWTTNNSPSPLIVIPTQPKQFYRLQLPY